MEYLMKLLNGNWIDDTTRLPNKGFFNSIYPLLKNSDSKFYIITINVNFDAKNKEEEEFIIARIASIIKHSVRLPKDFVCRTDVKEFSIILHGINEIVAKQIASRIKESLNYLVLNYGNDNIKIESNIKIDVLGGASSE